MSAIASRGLDLVVNLAAGRVAKQLGAGVSTENISVTASRPPPNSDMKRASFDVGMPRCSLPRPRRTLKRGGTALNLA
jgi:hypothetical protein